MATARFDDWVSALHEPAAERRPHRSYRATWHAVRALAGVAVEAIGESVRGEPIWALVREPARPARATTFVLAGLHAMEHVGVATALALFDRPAAFAEHRLVVVPMANPDGFLAAEACLARGSRRFVRKNAHGVDLNRNFAAYWDDRYYLNRILPRVFAPGGGPLSEPEARAIDHALGRHRPRFAASLHAFGRWIFTPYAGSRAAPRDLDRMLEIAHAMAACQADPYRVLQLARRSRLFQAHGAEIDHFYDRHGALAFLFEIGSGPRLAQPATWFDPYAWFTPPSPFIERDIENVLPALAHLGELE